MLLSYIFYNFTEAQKASTLWSKPAVLQLTAVSIFDMNNEVS